MFDWESRLNNIDVNNCNEQVSDFNKTVINVMSNFTPDEITTLMTESLLE